MPDIHLILRDHLRPFKLDVECNGPVYRDKRYYADQAGQHSFLLRFQGLDVRFKCIYKLVTSVSQQANCMIELKLTFQKHNL